ncbi:Mrr restriction system protein [Methanimicrococcus sp. At1]|uniref:Mrr restriction system protein n=1 Tax=Methanimicrococcus hacksteinii TaxID=3028293 RepID=A0ABU3VQ48_9EURY|nr:restriction endonuclease [Methanimicrococcus sp. At1]MDV0445534.1 Mrr restriction system protein [Methanimicrococcus sp. At1]
MVVPKLEKMYLPLLECLKDGKEHTSKEINDFIANYLEVSDEDRMELLPSGNMEIFRSRATWTRTYLKKAGLIKSTSRGIFVISEDGKKILQNEPESIGLELFLKNETFREFYLGKKSGKKDNSTPSDIIEGTPQDSLEEAFQKINSDLADELLSEIMELSPTFFERLVVKLLENIGYGGSLVNAGEVVGKSGDEGIDGIIREDKLGFDLIYIQAKRWDIGTTIGRPEIQKFVGALAGQGATKGLFITTAKFSKDAHDYAKKQHTTKVVLVDGQLLTKLMIEHNLGVSIENTYEVKRIDSDFFSD